MIYYLVFPRIPVPIERRMKVFLMLFDQKLERRRDNMRNLDQFTVGSQVEAIWGDDENEPAWYKALIEVAIEPQEKDKRADGGVRTRRYEVVFPEYGNRATVDLGEMRIITSSTTTSSSSSSSSTNHHHGTSSSRSKNEEEEEGEVRSENGDDEEDDERKKRRSNSSSHSSSDRHKKKSSKRKSKKSKKKKKRRRKRSSSRDSGEEDERRSRRRRRSSSSDHGRRRRGRSENEEDDKKSGKRDLMAKVLEMEKEASLAIGRDYARKPASYKGSLSMKLDRYTYRKEGSEEVESYRPRK